MSSPSVPARERNDFGRGPWRGTLYCVTPDEFVPAEFVVPTEMTFGGVRLVPLGPEHNEADYAAWTSSIDHIRATPGFPDGSWPTLMSVSENLRDLERHAEDF